MKTLFALIRKHPSATFLCVYAIACVLDLVYSEASPRGSWWNLLAQALHWACTL